MTKFLILFLTMLAATPVFAAKKYPFIKTGNVELTQNFVWDRQLGVYRLYHESTVAVSQLTDLTHPEIRHPWVSTPPNDRQVPSNEEKYLTVEHQADGSRLISVPRFDEGETDALTAIPEQGENFTLSGVELTQANQNLLAPTADQTLKAVFSDAVCSETYSRQFIACKFRVDLFVRCKKENNCEL